MSSSTRILQIVGEIVREHGLAPGTPILRIIPDPEGHQPSSGAILYQLPINADTPTCVKLTEEVIDRMIEENLDGDDFTFSFIPVVV